MTPHYYNEFDEQAAQWLRNLIAAGHIPAGDVDTRSITDVHPTDLIGYKQCHFFAGIGGWALAARIAGWPEDRQLWTGSCPCQPFSVAGRQLGADDERHLWPDQLRLIRAAWPDVWMGEQVAAAVGKDWLDGVLADLEAISYTGGACVVPACAVNAPHRRDRIWIVAGRNGVLGHGQRAGLEGHAGHEHGARGRAQPDRPVAAAGRCGDVADGDRRGASSQPGNDAKVRGLSEAQRRAEHGAAVSGGDSYQRGAWDDAAWLIGHDGKARRVEPGIRLLVDGLSPWLDQGGPTSKTASRQVALKGLGNAIVPELAAEVIAAWMDVAP
jgi:DNA (cytosine-5)-methyltransferase 1